ncbi:alpha/beta hydrolase family protein [Pseudonocardia sp. TRM90224]|uniref:alpha/beta hydrolase family protein n=1 Tax=Pseudonocardia sp. TRM90224 TaxID=2812678 RepID=UPI001E3239BD|nr:alpha/beta fold hydrolase [Pseudonocardia sp. TRM90224]
MEPDFPAGTLPPASTPAVVIPSAGVPLPGVLHLPAGSGPHPAVVLLHGFPGNERNFDLAQHLRRAGFATLVFHYRGSWGADGSWSWQHVLDDSAAAVAWVREQAGDHRLDATRLAVVGHSLGGFAALTTAAADPAIPAVASITAFDVGWAGVASAQDGGLRAVFEEAFDGQLLPLRGTSGKALVDEMVAAGPKWRLADRATALADRAVLLVGATLDADAPAEQHHHPLVEAYGAIDRLEHCAFPTDHALSDHRLALGQVLVEFLGKHL